MTVARVWDLLLTNKPGTLKVAVSRQSIPRPSDEKPNIGRAKAGRRPAISERRSPS
jgi:hypothetical protein